MQINYGIKTGLNEAFIIDEATRAALLAEDPKSAEIIRPILRGRDIKKYKAEFAGLYILFVPWHFPLHNDPTIKGASEKAELEFQKQYSAVYNHLLKFKKELSARNKAETGIRYEWYALQRWGADYWEDFEKPKIVYIEIMTDNIEEGYDFPCLAFADKGVFILNTAYMMTGDDLKLKNILTVLNSPIGRFIAQIYTLQLGKRQYRMLSQFVQNFPIAEANDTQKNELAFWLDKILQNGLDLKEAQAQINKIVYLLYSISKIESEYLEKSF